MEILMFTKMFILFFAITIVIKEVYRLIKSATNQTDFEISPRGKLYFGLAVSYVFTYIFF